MKIYYYMGSNVLNKSGVSWKIWKIERAGAHVTTWWGPAKLVKRRVVPTGRLQSNPQKFSSVELAKKYEVSIVASKLKKGYERNPRCST